MGPQRVAFSIKGCSLVFFCALLLVFSLLLSLSTTVRASRMHVNEELASDSLLAVKAQMYSENDAPGRIAGMRASVTATLSVTTLKSPIAPVKEPNVEFMLITEKDYQNIGVVGEGGRVGRRETHAHRWPLNPLRGKGLARPAGQLAGAVNPRPRPARRRCWPGWSAPGSCPRRSRRGP